MNRACSRSRLRNPLLFTPLNLFSTGEQGAWYDPSDMATLFQDDAGTIPVTAAGQVVGRMRDKSGNNHHATQVTAASKPILRNTGTLWWLEFDGVDDFLSTGNIDLSATDEVSVFTGLRKLSDAATAIAVEFGNGNDAQGIFYALNVAGGAFQCKSRGSVNAFLNTAVYAAPFTGVVSMISNISAPSLVARVNTIQTSTATSQGTGNYGNYPLYIGRRAGTSLPFFGNIYGLIVRGALTDSSGIAASEKYMAAKSGVTI